MQKTVAILFTAVLTAAAFSADIVKLPAPQRKGGAGLFTVLNQRRSVRRYSEENLSQQELSNILWAGFGISGKKDKRTAPTAVNRQEFTLYAILADGAYKYIPQENGLEKIASEDLRPLAAGNVTAPAYILIVADMKKAASAEYAAIDTGYISQNLYLAATAQGLGSCAIGSFKRDAGNLAKLAAALKLGENEKPILSQSVGKLK